MASALAVEATSLASKPSAGGAARPNILFALADDMGHASAYGTPWVHTPNFDRLAKAGVLFMNAYTPDPKCSPSRACILTGRNPWQLEAAANHWSAYPAKFKSWMEALDDVGYFTGFTGKGWGPGQLPPERNGIVGKAFKGKQLEPPTKGISKGDYAGDFAAFLAKRSKDQPFCFWYGGHEPHRKYQTGSGLELCGYKLTDIDRVPSFWPDNEDVRGDMLDYAFEVAYFDAQLGKMLELLKAQGLLENTLVIVASDNGPPFPRLKGHIFEEAAHLPMVASWPKGIVQPGRRCEELISYIDLAPTFLELAGAEAPKTGMQPITGHSFTDILANRKPTIDRSTLLLGRERQDVDARKDSLGYPVRAMRTGKYFYSHNFEPDRWPCGDPSLGLQDTDGGPTKEAVQSAAEGSPLWQLCFGKRPADELYDVSADPDCVHNLAANPEFQPLVDGLRGQLFKQLSIQADPRMSGHGEVFDCYVSPRTGKKRGGGGEEN